MLLVEMKLPKGSRKSITMLDDELSKLYSFGNSQKGVERSAPSSNP